jgi:hypothetical protein|tara:strand:+ start:5290 stop:5517 length:228 start_codon:yes stop_codon:yes gene_type:complete
MAQPIKCAPSKLSRALLSVAVQLVTEKHAPDNYEEYAQRICNTFNCNCTPEDVQEIVENATSEFIITPKKFGYND